MFASLAPRPLLTLLAASACAVAFFLGHASPSRGGTPPRHHTVRTGETLWTIAEGAYPASDPRDAVYRIERANRLPGAAIAAGQTLVLP